jgi:uncharacterized protein
LADHFVKDPHDVVQPGQRVMVKVLAVEPNKRQISLTMKISESSKNLASSSGASRSVPVSRPRPQASRPKHREDFSNNPFAKLAGLDVGKGRK